MTVSEDHGLPLPDSNGHEAVSHNTAGDLSLHPFDSTYPDDFPVNGVGSMLTSDQDDTILTSLMDGVVDTTECLVPMTADVDVNRASCILTVFELI